MWPDRRLLNLFKIDVPIVQAPMAGVQDVDVMIGAAQGGALASLPCAMLSSEKMREQIGVFRQRITDTPTIRNTARCDHRHPYRIDYLRHQRENTGLCRDVVGEKHTAVTARLCALCDNRVGTAMLKPHRLFHNRCG